MSKVTSTSEFGNMKDAETFIRFVAAFLLELQPVINGRIEFDQNIASQTITTYFAGADTNLAISHKLARTGLNYLVASKTKACDIYRGSTDSMNIINLKSTVAGVTVTLVLF